MLHTMWRRHKHHQKSPFLVGIEYLHYSPHIKCTRQAKLRVMSVDIVPTTCWILMRMQVITTDTKDNPGLASVLLAEHNLCIYCSRSTYELLLSMTCWWMTAVHETHTTNTPKELWDVSSCTAFLKPWNKCRISFWKTLQNLCESNLLTSAELSEVTWTIMFVHSVSRVCWNFTC